MLQKGAYVIADCEGGPDIIILASGSEVHVSIEAAAMLAGQGVKARVVSFPSWFLFDRQEEAYRKSVLPAGKKFAVVEAGLRMGWERYSGSDALFITMESFGASAPAEVLADHFGFTPAKIAESVKKYLKK
jgi:transketolase